MKMAIRFWRHTRVLLILTGLAFLGACGSDTSDLTGPMLTMDAMDPSTFTSQRTLSGRIEAGAGLEIVVNTDARVGEPIPGDGTWECTITDLAVGGNLVTVSADDSKGNTSSLQFVLLHDLLKIDQIDTVTALPSSTVYGRVASAEGASIASVTFNGAPVAWVPDAGGAFSVTLDNLVEGNNTLTIVAENVATGDIQTITRTISREATAASLTIAEPEYSIPYASRTVNLAGTVEQGGTVAVSVEPEATVGTVTYTPDPTATFWQVTINDLEERDSIITVTASLEGKSNATVWTRVVVDTVPTLIGTEPAEGAMVSRDTLVTATFSEAVVASKITFLLSDAQGDPVEGTVEYRAKDNAVIFTPAALLPAGSYEAVISGVQDPDGNTIDTFTRNFTVQ